MLVAMALGEVGPDKSSKGTIIRGKVKEKCSNTIERAYSGATLADRADVPDKDVPTIITQIVQPVLGERKALTEQTDLFSYGVDSVACIQIRHSLTQLLPPEAGELPLTVVEDCGTIGNLSDFVLCRRNGQDDDSNDATRDYRIMLDLVEEYSNLNSSMIIPKSTGNGTARSTNGIAAIPKDEPASNDRPKEDVVVLTGATGALGAQILDIYRKSNQISTIYCLVRGADDYGCL